MYLDLFKLDGRVALITGGSQGLGFVMAQALAEAGADVIVTSRQSAHTVRTVVGGVKIGADRRPLAARWQSCLKAVR